MLRCTGVAITALTLLACDRPHAITDPIASETPPARTLGTGNGILDLGLPTGVVSAVAYGVNGAGRTVGYGETATGATVAFQWTQSGGMTELAKPLGWGATMAFAVNDAGTIAGGAILPSGAMHAVTWSGGTLTDLGTIAGGAASIAFSVNGAGQTVGYSDRDATGIPRAFLHTPGVGMRDLGVLPGGWSAAAQDINDAGTVVGASNGASMAVTAFRWTSNGGMVALPALQGQRESFALAINARGDIVGFAVMASDNRTRAVVWPSTGGVVALAGLANNVATVAFDINDRGEIAGYSEANNGQRYRAVWWTRRGAGWNSAEDLKANGNPQAAYGQVISQGTGGQPTYVAGFVNTGGANRPTLWQ